MRGNIGVSFQDRTICLIADEERYMWNDFTPFRQEEVFTQSTVTGQIGSVRVRLSELEQIANASSDRGSIGGRAFKLMENHKVELRKFLSAMRNPANWTDSPS